MANDGSISISVKLDDKDAMRELTALQKKIEDLQRNLNEKRAARSDIEAQMQQAEVGAEKARQRVEQLKAALEAAPKGERAGIRAQLTEANADLRQQSSAMDRLNNQWQKLNTDIANGESNLERMTNRAADLERQVAAGQSAFAKVGAAASEIGNRIGKVFSRIGKMIARVFLFNVISRGLRELRQYLADLAVSFPEVTSAIATLKGALLTMIQPIVSAVIPVFVQLLNIITQVVLAISSLVSKAFGTTVQDSAAAAEALNDQANAYKKTGGAASKAAKQLLSFDEINQMSGKSGGGGSSSIAPSFDFDFDDSQLDKILTIVEAIGAALLGRKIGSALGMNLGQVLGLILAIEGAVIFVKGYLDAWNNGINFGNLIKMVGGLAAAFLGLYIAVGPVAAGVALAIGGIAMAVLAVKDAWENGVTWENMLTLLIGIAAAAAGLALAFGPVAAGIVLIAGGIAMLVLGIKDIMANGLNLKNGLLVIAGILAAGLGISLLVGGPIPLLIAAIVAIVTALTMLGGTFEQVIDGFKQILNGFMEFFTGVFTGDWNRAWEGLTEVFKGIANVILGIFGGIVNAIIKGLNWVIGKLNLISFTLPDWVPLVGGSHFGVNINTIPEWKVPQLANGAVIPPNREFLAVLGDQRSGTNIEAPLETIVAAFRQAMADGGGNRTLIMQVDRQELGRIVFNSFNAENNRVGVRLGGTP